MSKEMPVKKIVRTKSALKLALAVGMVLVGLGLVIFGLRGVLHNKVYIKTPKALIRAEVADDETERVLGLSGRDGLAENKAMLFVFEEPETHGIWMKDMKFAIDIVWLNKDKKVITISSNVKPDSYPKRYFPDSDSKYVIELAAGQASKLGIKTHQTLSW